MMEVQIEDRRQRKGETERKITSILRPSTRVPWSFSLAFSASALFSNVTKPKPCGTQQRLKEVDGKQAAHQTGLLSVRYFSSLSS